MSTEIYEHYLWPNPGYKNIISVRGNLLIGIAGVCSRGVYNYILGETGPDRDYKNIISGHAAWKLTIIILGKPRLQKHQPYLAAREHKQT